ncbi:MAG: DUF3883 domain-containing protein [Alcanivorax sediminis]|uniref:DUF3883 domain-containing protein n=1 Tax=Alcanivorax sediminis TaxID=2663008 RepID=UPI003C4E7019
MARGTDWSEGEISATVADYMRMLTLELSGQKYNKTTHRRELLEQLDGRSEAAVERKHQNISAVLRDLDCLWIPGYKPNSHYQEALARFVEHWINTHPEFDRASKAAAEQPTFLPSSIDFSRFVVDAPTLSPAAQVKDPEKKYTPNRTASKRDYIAREARNTALGLAGELLVLEFEEHRLRTAGQKQLANKIEHVSVTEGDGLGFDIRSFETNGKERLIEVKTTAFAKETPFYASHSEVSFSSERQEDFYLYRLFEFRKSPKLFTLQGKISRHCALNPMSYLCHFR